MNSNPYGPAPAFQPPLVPPPAPVRNSRTAVTTLIVLASLLLVSTGVFVTLFLMASNDHIDTVARLDNRQQELTEMDGRLASAEAARKQADERNTRLKASNATMSSCVKAMQHYLWDGLADEQRTAAARDLLTKCR
ncbi:hypothetical protein ALI144C_17960 [Actinosynnema sp. ALI-1.44]|nr:hypothetical protein ALI144C_17960 [Actinosynnema sp. ALI-1.44]